jgi:hypothetical protein
VDALCDDVAELDGPLLAALWTRAVLAADADVVARCETECARRGVTTARLLTSTRRPLRALVAAKKKDDEGVTVVGERREGPRGYQDIVTQAQKNIREGKSYETGQATYETSKSKDGKNPYRRGKGKGGGQFTSKEHSGESTPAETTDPNKPRGKPLQEDDPSIPKRSPGGAKIKDFRNGMMIYADGTRYDAQGWRNAKGQALDDNGKVIKKSESDTKVSETALDRAKEKARKDRQDAAKEEREQESREWDLKEARRKAEVAAAEGDYGPLLSILERNETAARKARDLAKNPTSQARLEQRVARAQRELAQAERRAERAERAEDRAGTSTTSRSESEREADEQAKLRKIVANYPQWEKELRARYEGVGLSEAEMKDLIIRDRAERISLLPRDYGETPSLTRGPPSAKKAPAKKAPAKKRERMQEDESPVKSPSGAKLVSFNNGVAKYADGWTFDGTTWKNRAGKPTTDRPGRRVSGNTAALVAAYDPALHPKGKDGKWIKKFGLIDVFGLSGFQHGQRGHKQVQGEVVEIVPNPKSPGDPIIRVKMTDPRWDASQFGETVDVKRSQVAERTTPKAKLPSKAPTPDIAKAKPPAVDTGVPPPRTPTPKLTPHPDGPNFPPIELPPDWQQMDPPARLAFLKDRMDADLTKWRGEPTEVDFTGFDTGIAFNLANTYRDLANWDPDTARRIDNPILGNQSMLHAGDLGGGAIAVAHPGTSHPGGIGKKVGPAQIVFGGKYVKGMKFWEGQKANSAGLAMPHSTSSMTGDPTITLVHEFGHHRQFRYLDVAMRDAGKAWSPTVREDGFGLIPDSSNWPETQALRYQIPKQTQTQYGHSKSSEGFAEGIAERALGISSPALDATFDEWDEYMGLALHLPTDRHAQSTDFESLTAAQRDEFWQTAGPYLELPGMRDHYPDTAKEYDTWLNTKPEAEPTADEWAAGLKKLAAQPQNQGKIEPGFDEPLEPGLNVSHPSEEYEYQEKLDEYSDAYNQMVPAPERRVAEPMPRFAEGDRIRLTNVMGLDKTIEGRVRNVAGFGGMPRIHLEDVTITRAGETRHLPRYTHDHSMNWQLDVVDEGPAQMMPAPGATREAGNVYVGDEIALPGDLAGTVTGIEPLTGDWMRLDTDMGSQTVRMSDPVTVIRPAMLRRPKATDIFPEPEPVEPTPQGAQVAVLDQTWGRSVIDTTIRTRYERDTAYIEAQIDAGAVYYNVEYPDGTGTGGLARWVHKRRLGESPSSDSEKDYAALDSLKTDKPNNRRLNHWAKRIAHGIGQDHYPPDDTNPGLNAAVDEAIALNSINPKMGAAVTRFGTIPVSVVKTDHHAAARQLGVGTTVIMNDPLEWGEAGDTVDLDGPITGGSGDSWTVSKGLAGTLRHEYGHYVETMVSNGAGPELAEPYARWRAAYQLWNGGSNYNVSVGTDITAMDDAGPGGLSKYGRANSMEGFAETFALVTHPDFDRSTIPDGPLADMVDSMLELIGAP